MTFDWGDFSTLAGELIETSSRSEVPEAAVRAAIGRTYYAVFGAARDLLRARGVEIPQKSAHATVRRLLSASDDIVEQYVGAALVELFRLRAVADYDASPDVPLTLERAEHAHLVGRSALTALRSIAAEEPDRPQGRP